MKYPRAVLLGLGAQMIILPLVCFAIARGFALAPELAVGLTKERAPAAAPVAD